MTIFCHFYVIYLATEMLNIGRKIVDTEHMQTSFLNRLICSISFALCFSVVAQNPAVLTPTFGPEIEFQGRKMLLGQICTGLGKQKKIKDFAEFEALLGTAKTATYVAAGVAGASSLAWLNYELASNDNKKGSHDGTTLPATILGTSLAVTLANGRVVNYLMGCKDSWGSYSTKSTSAYDTRIEEEVKKLCADGHCIYEQKGASFGGEKNFTIVYGKENLIIEITHDPNTIEVKTNPLTLAQLEEYEKIIQNDVYGTLKKAGLKPPVFDGPWNGGHIHIDLIRGMNNDPKILRSFLIDLYEHEAMFAGALGWDPYNGKLVRQDPERIKQFKALIDSLDVAIEQKLPINKANIDRALFSKNSFLNMKTFYPSGDMTLELRALRSQKNAKTLTKLAKLFQARINSLRDVNLPAPVYEVRGFRTPFHVANAFHDFVTKAGLKWSEFGDLMPWYFQVTLPHSQSIVNDVCVVPFQKLFTGMFK